MTTFAFPSGHNPQRGRQEDGMTLRDYFAAKALNVELSGNPCTNEEWRDDVARKCYLMADALLKARDE